MKKVGLLAALCALAAAAPVFAKDDFQYWNTVEITKRLNPKWEVFVRPEMRMEDGATHLFYHEYRQGVRRDVFPHLQVGVNYLFARNETAGGKTKDEHAGEIDVTPKWKWGPVNVSVRGRAEMRQIQGNAGEIEYRVRLSPKAAYPMTFRGHKVIPYAAIDLFYDYTRKAWNQHRDFLGVVIPFWETKKSSLSSDFYYMHQNLLGARRDRSSNHILGTRLIVQF